MSSLLTVNKKNLHKINYKAQYSDVHTSKDPHTQYKSLSHLDKV